MKRSAERRLATGLIQEPPAGSDPNPWPDPRDRSGLRLDISHSSRGPIPTHFRAYHKIPTGWRKTGRYSRFAWNHCHHVHRHPSYNWQVKNLCHPPTSTPWSVPARQAYSHSASVGRTYFHPLGNRPADCSIEFKRVRKICTSSHETFSTGRLLPLNWLGSAFKPSAFPFITVWYWAWVTSYLPR